MVWWRNITEGHTTEEKSIKKKSTEEQHMLKAGNKY